MSINTGCMRRRTSSKRGSRSIGRSLAPQMALLALGFARGTGIEAPLLQVFFAPRRLRVRPLSVHLDKFRIYAYINQNHFGGLGRFFPYIG